MRDNIDYARINDSANNYVEGSQNLVQTRRGFISISSSFVVGVMTMGVITALYMTIMMPEQSHARKLPYIRSGSDSVTGLPLSWSHGDCGNSPEDARARDCRYSIVLHAWLPQSCLTEADAQDAETMYKERNWIYTAASGQNLTMHELATGDFGHFVTAFDWHVTHCMYVWKRLHRTVLDPNKELDSYTASYHHTSHCVKMIAGRSDGMVDLGTKVFVKYPKCAK
ncbi:hypothetical protein F66182_8879 [Fusarium sp. NRRL 66182]|nr:hypothetical protein F66182_8879 [Fusarium sp. NRRL 66182]